MTEPTKGPWIESQLAPAYILGPAPDFETICSMGEYDCQGFLEIIFPNAPANASLIKAAPDLLAALEQAGNCLRAAALDRTFKDEGRAWFLARATEALNVAAKARGTEVTK